MGASLALALSDLGFEVTLIEAVPVGATEQPSFDDRTTALSNGSRRVFEALNVWGLVEREATAIRRIHVSDRGRFGFARIDAPEQGLKALGFVVTNRTLGAALWRRLKETHVRVLAPAKVETVQLRAHHRVLTCSLEGRAIEVEARIVVAADGARSAVRESAGIAANTWPYDQTALVTNVFTQRFHDHIAYERFTDMGPIALLPLSDARMGLIWALAPPLAAEFAQLPEAAFLSKVQEAFGFRVGRFTRVGARQLYPLTLTRSTQHIAERLAIIGNAAQALHPIAGQGFNLGLRDAACLAEILAEAKAQDRGVDAGDGLLLARYSEWRGADRSRIVAFTDGLVRLFTQPLRPVKFLRDVGLLAFDLFPAAKDAMSQLSLGAAGKVPRLARGAKLKSSK